MRGINRAKELAIIENCDTMVGLCDIGIILRWVVVAWINYQVERILD